MRSASSLLHKERAGDELEHTGLLLQHPLLFVQLLYLVHIYILTLLFTLEKAGQGNRLSLS
jgi:hypothetical protein